LCRRGPSGGGSSGGGTASPPAYFATYAYNLKTTLRYSNLKGACYHQLNDLVEILSKVQPWRVV